MRRFLYLFKVAAVGSFLLFFSACMTVMYGVPYKLKNGRVTVTNGSGVPILGLSVRVTDLSTPDEIDAENTTNSDGTVSFSIESYGFSDIQIDVEDIDGPRNLGEFQSESILIESDDFEDGITKNIDISLDEG